MLGSIDNSTVYHPTPKTSVTNVVPKELEIKLKKGKFD